jgi:transcription antitermination factor NusG
VSSPDIYFLNAYRRDAVLRERLCIGDIVQVRSGALEGRRGTVEKISLEDQSVVVKQEFGSTTVSNCLIRSLIDVLIIF